MLQLPDWNRQHIIRSVSILLLLLFPNLSSTQIQTTDPTIIPPLGIKSNHKWVYVPEGTSDEELKKMIAGEVKSRISEYEFKYEETTDIFENWMREKQDLNDRWKSGMLELNTSLREAISKVSKLRQEAVVLKNELDVKRTQLDALKQTLSNDSLSLKRYINEREFIKKNLTSQLEDITYMAAVLGRRPLGNTEMLSDVLGEIGDRMLVEAITEINGHQIKSETVVKDYRLIEDLIVDEVSGHAQVLDSYTNDFAHEPPEGGDVRYLIQAIEVSPFKRKKVDEKTGKAMDSRALAYILNRENIERVWQKENLDDDPGKNDLKQFIINNIITQAEKHNRNVSGKIRKIYYDFVGNLSEVNSRIDAIEITLKIHQSNLWVLENEYSSANTRLDNYDNKTLNPAIDDLQKIEDKYRYHCDNRVFLADKTEEGKVITSIAGAYSEFGERTVEKISEFKEAEYTNTVIAVDYKLASFSESLVTFTPDVRAFTVLYLSKKTYSKSLNYIACIGYQLALNPTAGAAISGGCGLYSEPLTGMEFVRIPGGSFMMGSEDGDFDEKPVHEVTLKPFYMMTTEVTLAMWKAVMGSYPSYFKGDNLPVEQVSWNDIQDFLSELNMIDPGKNYRLPSEAEWEYACRAGTTNKYYSGNNKSDLGQAGWYQDISGRKTHPVGQKEANAWGLYDMHGNVWEWCEDWYHSNYNGAPTDGSGWVLPSGQYRVLRGGSWLSVPNDCRSAARLRYLPSLRTGYVGFRLCVRP